MKAASSATLAILASGQYLKIEFYKFALPKVGTFGFHNADTNVPITISGQTYYPGLTITRSGFTQKVGLEVQSVDLTIAPQSDAPGGSPTIGGIGFLSAVRAGFFDGGVVTIYKGFFNPPSSGILDLSPGIVPWFQGIVDEVQCDRFSVDITVNDSIQLLNVQMPRNILSSGCVHILFDAGCTLSKASYTTSASITSGVGALTLTASGLTQAAGYFALGVITFTSGVLSGSSYAVSTFSAGGVVVPIAPWASLPSVGDTFTIVPGCDKAQATCSGKYGNLAHYRGAPYVPQPETLYDGGTSATTAPALGGQGGQGAGSPFGGNLGRGTYKP